MATKNSLFFILFLFQVWQLNAQTEKGFLKMGGTVITNISPKERHRYKIKMAKDEIATLKLLQIGTDVIISTFDFTGEKLNDFDSPNGSNGYEAFSITSTHKGEYFFEIKSFDENTSVGKYDLTIQKIKHKAVTPFEKTDELLEQYDNDNFPLIGENVTDSEMVKYLMKINNLHQKDLASIFGGQANVSKFLNGERGLGKNHISELKRKFKISADFFLK